MTDTPAFDTKPWWHHRSAQLAALLLLVCLGTVLRVASLDGVVRRTPDEYTYTNSANTLLDIGTTAGYPVLFADFAKDPVRPSPTRIGYHALLMATMRLTGNRTPQAGAWLACGASILSLALLAVIGWRFFTPVTALAATLLYAVSPAELMFARRCWEESLVELLCLAALGLAFAVMTGSRRIVFYPLFALIGIFAFVVKELCAATFLLAAAWCIVHLLRHRELRTAVCIAASTLAAVVLALAWSAERLGGIAQLAVVSSKVSEVSPYALAYTSGPAWLMLLGLWIISAVTALLALVGLAALVTSYVAPRRTADCIPHRTILLGLTLIGALFLGLTMVFPEKLNLRFICPSFGPLALLAGVGFCALLRVVRSTLPATEGSTLTVLAIAFLLVAAALDDHNFQKNFAATDMQDLSIRMVVEASGRAMPGVAQAAQSTQSQTPAAGGDPVAAQQIALSAQLIQQGQNEQGIAAAERALALDPQSAVAWNNIAAANENLERWDAAIDAAQHALQLQPGFQLARNNLAWSMEQKAKSDAR